LKKKAKNFYDAGQIPDLAAGADIKVFCFFSSEKKNFLFYLANKAGAPITTSRTRFSTDSDSAICVGTPNNPHTSTNPPSCTPTAPGTAKPALRAAIAKLSIT
jgi:hypothetical protein